MEKGIHFNIEYRGYGLILNLGNRIIKGVKRWVDAARFARLKMEFGQREDDIYVVTFPKSGTTVMQMILYQLFTDGNMDFNHIYELSPWPRNAAFLGQKLPDLPSPRIIKSHDSYGSFDRSTKGRFIFVYRNGMDVAVSLFHQSRNYNKPNLKFDEFAKDFLKKNKRSWFSFCRDWLRNKKRFPILYVRYEDLLANKRKEIDRILHFLEKEVSEETIQRAMDRSNFEFMKSHETKFGVQPSDKPKPVWDQFIRKGQTGEGEKYFNQEQVDAFQENYDHSLKDWENRVFGRQRVLKSPVFEHPEGQLGIL